jgi:hypothetical protein
MADSLEEDFFPLSGKAGMRIFGIRLMTVIFSFFLTASGRGISPPD